MKAVAAKLTRGLNIGSILIAADNSGARMVKIVSVKGGKSRKGRQQAAARSGTSRRTPTPSTSR